MDEPNGMFEPKFTYAYEMLQRDLEGFLKDSEFGFEREHEFVDWFKERDVFRYDITQEGKDLGSVYYCWGEDRIIQTHFISDRKIRYVFDYEFRDQRERFLNYADEFRYEKGRRAA